jgi:hypothetical protein
MGEEASNFSYGTYGDDIGVDFWGPPQGGFWIDCLPISDRFVEPLFIAIMRAAERTTRPVPRVVAEWNDCSGWTESTTPAELSRQDAQALVDALVSLSLEDLPACIAGATAQDCIRCAQLLATFLSSQLSHGESLFISRS